MKNSRTRIELIDLAKAVTIFLVIMGHTTGNLDTPLFRRVLYSFHMPLFFFLAGMSTKPVPLKSFDSWKKFLKKNILALAVPYIFWGLLYAPFSFEIFPKLFYASWKALSQIGTLTSLWYLSAFFTARIMVQIIITIVDSFQSKNIYLVYIIISVIMFIIGFVCPHLDTGYPWCFDVAFVASGFILLGIALRNAMLILAQEKAWILALAFVVGAVVLMIGTVFRANALELSLMCDSNYGNTFWFLLNSASGTVLVMSFSMIFIRIAREGFMPFGFSPIAFIGQHTMGIFLLHKNMLQQLIIPLLGKFEMSGEALILLSSILALGASMILCVLIERYVPQLLGQFPKYE
ncbi:acyltransferase family protein [Butyrivibrio sp. AC2005]|uniref:acyltransferase family protein n=1 Tax=Butyrivibrio sp. AC2005 TaxID=1280672 RepID=UPI00041C020C|nr:acyltransferase family protein [Butyrivibrio sp. AC2005]